MHLPQNRFESNLRLELTTAESQQYCTQVFGYAVNKIDRMDNKIQLHISNVSSNKINAHDKNGIKNSINKDTLNTKHHDFPETTTINPKYLIAADGSNSVIRESVGIKLIGESNMQELLNVHFICLGLRGLLKPRPAMLYFVFNEVKIICLNKYTICIYMYV